MEKNGKNYVAWSGVSHTNIKTGTFLWAFNGHQGPHQVLYSFTNIYVRQMPTPYRNLWWRYEIIPTQELILELGFVTWVKTLSRGCLMWETNFHLPYGIVHHVCGRGSPFPADRIPVQVCSTDPAQLIWGNFSSAVSMGLSHSFLLSHIQLLQPSYHCFQWWCHQDLLFKGPNPTFQCLGNTLHNCAVYPGKD